MLKDVIMSLGEVMWSMKNKTCNTDSLSTSFTSFTKIQRQTFLRVKMTQQAENCYAALT